MHCLVSLWLLAAAAGVQSNHEGTAPPKNLSPKPYADISGVHYPAGFNRSIKVNFTKEPRPEGLYTGCKDNETAVTEYPHFVRVGVTKGQVSLDSIHDPYREFGWRGYIPAGVIISEKYVLWSGLMCSNCTHVVIVGSDDFDTKAPRHKANPIPYIDDWKYMANPTFLILLELEKPIKFGPIAQPVALPEIGEILKSGDYGVLVGPSLYRGGHILNASIRKVLNQQDCNERIKNTTRRWRYQTFPTGTLDGDITEVPKDSFCEIYVPESGCFLGRSGVLFVQSKLVGIEYYNVHVVFDRGYIDYGVHYDMAYYRGWIKSVTGV
ncbi:hypothetical protein QAD02_016604 [Eretmocerus hayati]|uniref:Uncharacterized protein n=1 Tax=Eretmocerus hayati TaxID=131215 RepID=A0ACC2PEE8_9HYME|nr:hypothetical protein QAD02_016604 [Eretmocerus hayati]